MIQLLEILSVLLCLTLIGVFFFKYRHTNRNRVLFLSVLLFFIAYTQVMMLLYSSPFYAKILYITYSDGIVFYLVIPMIYMYMMNITYNRPFFSPLNGVNILPAIPGFVFVVYFNTLSRQEQVHSLLVKSCGILNDNWLSEIGMIIQLFYLIVIIVQLRLFIKGKGTELMVKSLHRLHTFSWFMYLFIILDIGFSVLLIILPSVSDIHNVIMVLNIIIFGVVYCLAFNDGAHDLQYIEVKKQLSPSRMKPTISNLDDASAVVFSHIENYDIYKNPRINLISFSKEINVPVYKVSACIKTKHSMSFPEYLNYLRIGYAKARLTKRKDDFIKMDYLAQECGFGSRSSFYAEFKKQIGVSPAEYQKDNP